MDTHTIKAMIRFKEARAAGAPWGTKCIVSMQRAADAGLVTIIYDKRNGLITDFEITPAGEAWTPPA